MILGAGTIAGISGVVPSLFFGVTKWVDFFWPVSTVGGTTEPEEETGEHSEVPIGAFCTGETDIDIDLVLFVGETSTKRGEEMATGILRRFWVILWVVPAIRPPSLAE